MSLLETLQSVARSAIEAVLPENAVKEALSTRPPIGPVVLVAIGKAAWRMANAAHEILGTQIARGCVVTKDGHSLGPISSLEVFECAHPVPEPRNLEATQRALTLVKGLTEKDTVLFLVSGGGSALFELPLDGVSLEDVADMTAQLLACGADIVEINTLRKRVSSVKGGRFAQSCAPARVYSVILSDVLGDRLDSIASGPAYPDTATSAEALAIVQKYKLNLSPQILKKLELETPKTLNNVETRITGSVSLLCEAACKLLRVQGYETMLLTSTLDCEAASAGAFFAAMGREAVNNEKRRIAFVAGGETVVKLRGKGKGGRCQEMALAAALGIKDLKGTAFIAAGSDGTDGPTDAAGGIVDGTTVRRICESGLDPYAMLNENNAYNALRSADALFITGPTGTNVNDLAILAIE